MNEFLAERLAQAHISHPDVYDSDRNIKELLLKASEEIEKLRGIKCKDCKWRDEYEMCTCPKIYEEGQHPTTEGGYKDDHLVYSYYEGGCFWVGENFGCVHGEKKQ